MTIPTAPHASCGLCDRPLYGDRATHYLCPGCIRATDERLARIPNGYEALAEHLAPAARPPTTIRSDSRLGGGLPVNERILDLRGPGGVVGVLEDWRAALHADLGWTPPTTAGSIPARITRAVQGLRDNLLWIASSWPAAGDFAHEIRDLDQTLRTIVDPPEPTMRVGYCPAVYEDGAMCGAVLHARLGVGEVVCGWCRAAYPPETWRDLHTTQAGWEAVIPAAR